MLQCAVMFRLRLIPILYQCNHSNSGQTGKSVVFDCLFLNPRSVIKAFEIKINLTSNGGTGGWQALHAVRWSENSLQGELCHLCFCELMYDSCKHFTYKASRLALEV